ncbi:hypothetical protein Y032_0033g2752 [Ancylostoma ceylanicum]|nr:hypothetical protein Y032_0033g2752 [Ancylostoma ceylanicum]
MNMNEQEQTREGGLPPRSHEQSARTPTLLAPQYVSGKLVRVGGNLFCAPGAVPSHYLDTDLRRYILLDQNRNSQEFGSTIIPTSVGNPVSAHELRRRVDSLDNAVYSPTIVNGNLQFVCLSSDTRSKSSTGAPSNVCSEIYQ